MGPMMAIEPLVKRTVAFFDGQNLFHHAKVAFGHTYPNFDPGKLAGSICSPRGWAISWIHFYTGVPSSMDKPIWNHFWTAKMAVMTVPKVRGINGTDWIRIDRATYDACIDPNDYRPKGTP